MTFSISENGVAEFEPELDLRTYPHEGTQSAMREIVFGPASPLFTLLAELDPMTGSVVLTIGNAPATSLLPKFLPEFLRELADECAGIEDQPQFREWVYGSPQED